MGSCQGIENAVNGNVEGDAAGGGERADEDVQDEEGITSSASVQQLVAQLQVRRSVKIRMRNGY